MKRIIAAVAIFLLITIPVFAAEITLLSGRDYFKTTLEEIEKAKESIHVVMYLIDPDKKEPLRLVKAIKDANQRGVKVKIVLEENRVNRAAYKLLPAASVHFGVPGQFIHSKAVVIDEAISILGSHNWTAAALAGNIETSVLIRVPAFARKLLSTLQRIRKTEALTLPRKGVKLSYSFFVGKKSVGSTLYTNHAERPFDLYLLLLKALNPSSLSPSPLSQRERGNNEKHRINFSKIKKELGISQDHLRKLLKRLEEHHLITYHSTPRQGSGLVELPHAGPSTNYIEIPLTYWDHGYFKKLSMKAKYFYLINLRERNLSKIFPWWQRKIKDIERTYGISKRSLTDASIELQRRDIIEVYRTAPKKGQFPGFRRPNRYLLKELRSDKEIQKEFKELEDRFGSKLLNQARTLADELNEPNDIQVIRTFIDLIQRYGPEKVAEANAVTGKLRPHNAKRHIGYTIFILKK